MKQVISILIVFVLLLTAAIGIIKAQVQVSQATLVNTINTSLWSPNSPDPAGIAYWSARNRLLVSDSEVEEMPNYYQGKNVFESETSGILFNTYTTTSFSKEPTGVAVNSINGHIFYSDDNAKKIFEVNLGPDGIYGSSDDTVTSFSTSAFGSNDPEGVAFGEGSIFIADGVGTEVYKVSPGQNGIFDGISPTGDDQVTHFDVSGFSQADPEGIEYNPDTGTLYVVSNRRSSDIAEVTTTGVLVKMIEISFLNPTAPAGLAYGPGSLDPNVKNIYITDRGVDNNNDPNENDGKIYEISVNGGSSLTPTPIPTPTPTPTQPPQILTFSPTDDTSIYKSSPNTNYGQKTTLEVDNSPVKDFLIKFSVSGVNGRVVSNAKLRLYNVNSSNKGGDFKKLLDNLWIEGTVVWNTAPGASDLIASLGSVSVNTWYEVNLSSYITGDGTYSLRISSTSNNGADYTSTEGTNGFIPQLVLTINQ